MTSDDRLKRIRESNNGRAAKRTVIPAPPVEPKSLDQRIKEEGPAKVQIEIMHELLLEMKRNRKQAASGQRYVKLEPVNAVKIYWWICFVGTPVVFIGYLALRFFYDVLHTAGYL